MFKLLNIFCRHKNKIKPITNYDGILQLGRCKKCGKHFLVNTAIKQMLPLNKKEYMITSAELKTIYKMLDHYDYIKSREVNNNVED